MSEPFEELVGLNKLIHEPARMAILSVLSACKSADFTFLQRTTGLTQGNLSGHLAKLEEAGLLQVDKQFVNRRPNTMVSLTARGRNEIEDHWKQLEWLRRETQNWKKAE